MPHFVATYVHPDPEGWARHLEAHLRWILEQAGQGTLRASGPTTGRDVRTALLVFTAPDENSLRETLSTDPYMEHGQVSELTITQWDPIFGVLAGESSRSALTDAELLGQLLKLAG
jgi:uncharacterized protein